MSAKFETTKFRLGHRVATPNALLQVSQTDIHTAISRHAAGDWGELDEHDRQHNDRALALGGRLFSAYTATGGIRFWVITEADRSATTVMLPEDY